MSTHSKYSIQQWLEETMNDYLEAKAALGSTERELEEIRGEIYQALDRLCRERTGVPLSQVLGTR